MTLPVVVSERAAREIDAACVQYAQHGRAEAFIGSLDRAFERMSQRPLMFPVVYDTVRRALLRRFPYSAFFVVEDAHVVVLAVNHQRSDPGNRPRL